MRFLTLLIAALALCAPTAEAQNTQLGSWGSVTWYDCMNVAHWNGRSEPVSIPNGVAAGLSRRLFQEEPEWFFWNENHYESFTSGNHVYLVSLPPDDTRPNVLYYGWEEWSTDGNLIDYGVMGFTWD